MLKKIIFTIPLFLIACASGPILDGAPINIQADQLSEYWTKPANFKTFYTEFGHRDGKCRKLVEKPQKADNPYVIYSYLIDSKGKTYERKYLEKSPKAVVDLDRLNMAAQGLVYIDGNVYEPSKTNIQKTPVKVCSKLYIIELPGDCDLIR